MNTAEATVSHQRFIPLSESKAREWIAALPLADPGETTKRVFYGLVDLNRRALPPQTRLAISELLRPVIDVALENLQRHLSARAFPLTPKSQKIFELTQSLLLEFSGSYQITVLDTLTKKDSGKKYLHVAIYRVLDYMGRVLLLTYSVYIRTREAIWHDIHHLYLLAVENGVDKIRVKEAASLGAPNIEMRYMQINLLSLVKPYCLRQGEAARLMHYFAVNSDLVTLARDADDVVGEYVHAAMLNSDEPAVMMLASDVPHSPTVRILNLNSLVATIDQHIRRLEEKNVPAMLLHEGLSRNLAKRVIYHLTAVRHRSFNRFPKKETKIGMVSRMSDVLLALKDLRKPDNGEASREEDMLFNVFHAADDYDEAPPKKVIQRAEEDVGARIQEWKVLNTSVGGYGLCWEGKEESGARVGEIVALRDLTNEQAPWMVGVVKWMEFVQKRGLCCGVELLSTKTMIVKVKKLRNRVLKQKLPIEGLMLPSIEGARPDPALVLPAYVFQTGDEICLELAEREERVRLLLLDECLGAFAYFRFATLVEKEVEAEEDEDDFTSLWQSL